MAPSRGCTMSSKSTSYMLVLVARARAAKPEGVEAPGRRPWPKSSSLLSSTPTLNAQLPHLMMSLSSMFCDSNSEWITGTTRPPPAASSVCWWNLAT